MASRRTSQDKSTSSSTGTMASRGDSHTVTTRAHCNELGRLRHEKSNWRQSWKQSWLQLAKNSMLVAFTKYIVQAVIGWLRIAILSPANILFDPVGVFVSLLFYPPVFLGLALAMLVLKFLSVIGAGQIVTFLGNKYASGYSIINWESTRLVSTNPDMFKAPSTRATLDHARKVLSGQSGPTTIPADSEPGASNIDFSPMPTTRVFDLDVAKIFLIFSALVYERVDAEVEQAARLVSTDRAKAEALLLKSESVIRQQAEDWDLRFEGISDLATTGGPFASVFYTKAETPDDERFIVLCFKGTTPTNYAEFLVDATVSRTTAIPFFGDGSAHAGFYSSLFPMSTGDADGYGQVLRSLKHIAREMGGSAEKPIPLWVTGHSLGSALASLTYARFQKMPADLGQNMVLRDSYVYGTPRVADSALTSTFEASTLTPFDRPNIMWRVINNWDIVCQVPPGLADSESNRDTLSAVSILNYAHLGAAIKLKPRSNPLYYSVQSSTFHSDTTVKVVSDRASTGLVRNVLEEAPWAHRLNVVKTGNPLAKVLMLLPPPLLDHFPSSYLAHLDKMRVVNPSSVPKQKQ